MFKSIIFILLLIIAQNGKLSAGPGSYYPPPSSVYFHNDTLTIYPPDSLPGEPVVLMGYNIYIDSIFFDHVPVSNPLIAVDFEIDSEALPPGDRQFCADAVYNEWISDRSCDSATIIYGYELPFLEDWSSGNFEAQDWVTSSGNWVVNNDEGNPAPAAEFLGDPVQTDYEINLESYPLNALGLINEKIWLDYNIKLDAIQSTGDEVMEIQVWNWTNQNWVSIIRYDNGDGGFAWQSEHVNIRSQTINRVFKVRFHAYGTNSSNIQSWSLDNIHIYRRCTGPNDIQLVENFNYNQLDWLGLGGCS